MTPENDSRQSAIEVEEAKPEADIIWGQYISSRDDFIGELTSLITCGDIDPEYQHRAIQVLLTPDINSLSFPMPSDLYIPTRNNIDWVDEATLEQVEYVAQLLPRYIKRSKEIAGSGSLSYDVLEAKKKIDYFNQIIIKILSKLPPSQANELFNSFEFDHRYVHNSSIEDLYKNTSVDEHWKRKAAVRIHDLISQEREEDSTSKRSSAIYYSYALAGIGRSEVLPVSLEFYQEEIAYLLNVGDKDIFYQFSIISRILKFIDDPSIRHDLANRLELEYNGQYGLSIAGEILQMFPGEVALKKRLTRKMKKWQKEVEEERLRTIEEVLELDEHIGLRDEVIERMKLKP